MPATDRPFNVLLSPDHVAQLAALAIARQCSKGHIIRDSIRHYFRMMLNHQPTCATGQPCLVPQLHQLPPSPPVPMTPTENPTNAQA